MFQTLTEHERAVTWEVLWNSAMNGIAIIDEDGTFRYANPAFCRITEYAENELQNKKFKDITHPADIEADIDLAAEVASGERGFYDMRKRYITKTGQIVWILLRVRPVKADDGSFLFFLSQIQELVPVDPVNIVEHPATPTAKALWLASTAKMLKNSWSIIVTIVTALGIGLAVLIDKLEKLGFFKPDSN